MSLWLYMYYHCFMKLGAPVFAAYLFRILMSLLMECSLNQSVLSDTCFISRSTCLEYLFHLSTGGCVRLLCNIHFLEQLTVYQSLSFDWGIESTYLQSYWKVCIGAYHLVDFVLFGLFSSSFLLNYNTSMILSCGFMDGFVFLSILKNSFKYFL